MMKLRPAMKRPYAVLHKNLEEIESHLLDLSSATTTGGAPPYGIDMAGKIDFLKALLAAEMETHAVDTPAHILHLGERLKRAEEALRNRNDFDLLSAEGLRNGSMCCSCTDDCFDDEAEQEEEEEDHLVPEPESDEDSVPDTEHFGPATVGNDKDLAQGRCDYSSWEGEDGEMVRAQRRHRFIVAAVAIAAAAAVAAAIGVATTFKTVEELFLVPT